MNYHRKILLLLMSLCFTSSPAQEVEPSPTMELFEFLGEWETEEGDWIDPFEFNDDEMAELIDISYEQDNEQDNE